jgi:hypothetical protein
MESVTAAVGKTVFLSHPSIYINAANILPRQARDKHRKNSQKVRFSQGITATVTITRSSSTSCSMVRQSKRASQFEPFYPRNDEFTQTGSGQA